MVAPKRLTRKERFRAAVRVAGITAKQWCKDNEITEQHLYAVLGGKRESARLTEKVDAFIAAHGAPRAAVPDKAAA
jgi:hypothetical protein